MLVAKRRLALNVPVDAWIEDATNQPEFDVTGISIRVVQDSLQLPGQFHADPADRFLVATARTLRVTLVTRDERIIDYGRAGHVGVMPV